MNLHYLFKVAEKIIRDNSPAILTAFGVSGTLTTAYLAAKASFKAAEILEIEKEMVDTHDMIRDTMPPLDFKEKVKIVWKLYIPAAVTGVVTIGCIVGATKIGNRRVAAMTAAYSLSERAMNEYKGKVAETLGERKEQNIRDSIAQDRVNQNQPPSREIVLAGSGNILCCELYTGRYFNSDMETLRKAQNQINAKALKELDANLNDFYYLIGLNQTTVSGDFGWTSDKLMELKFSTVLAEDDRPCLTFEYNYINKL